MGKLTRNHGDLCYNIDGDTMKQSENIKQSITEEDQAKQEIQRGLVNWANHVLDLYQQIDPEKVLELKQQLTSTMTIYEMSTIDFKRYSEMIQVIQHNYEIPDSVIYILTLTSLTEYNPAILSYSVEEILVFVQAFADIHPKDYSIYDNPNTPVISNRTVITQILKEQEYHISSAVQYIRSLLERSKGVHESGYAM
ncbi:MAG: hypothetical protein HFG15_03355 [Bacilli bacterium]|nr:hypothetical protein [Bacilli bacterium]